jgi:hypothetical protein
MNVKEILHREPPGILYHYTTQRGLLGIITTNEIWASHTQYLNDRLEFRHAIEIAKDELLKMKREPMFIDKMELLDEIESALGIRMESVNVCVCSFSADGDVLSQWRAYGENASGFSIGFSDAFLRSVCNNLSFWLVPVLYEEEQQRTLIRTLLEDVLEENFQTQSQGASNAGGELGDSSLPGGNLVAYLNRYAPLIKHKAFIEEHEWRIVSPPLSCAKERFGYREGASMLIPYFRIPLVSDTQPFGIKEIFVGPTPHPEQSIRSLRGLLTKNKLTATLTHSQVPYRNW